MISLKHLTKHTAFILSLIICSLFINNAAAQDGKALFTQHCASCHAANMHVDATGPALAGVEDRWADKALLHKWIKNSSAVIASGDKYANEIYTKFNKQVMTKFEGTLNDKDIDAILEYIKSVPAPVKGQEPGKPQGESSDNSLLFGILTLVLAVVAFVLLQVNSNLKKLTDDKDGVKTGEPVPFWRNRAYITLLTIILFLVGGFYVTKGAIGLGRTKDYQPVQPIFYSHKVHAGTNQISCLYCHGNTMEGKQANIPSLNVCMNCHMNVTEYSENSEKLIDGNGNEVNGTAEIAKLHKAVGFTKGMNANTWSMDTTVKYPVEWVKIHSLPDHVYFNHSQHVKAGNVQCQTCHGEIQKMDEVKQFAELSMGWCINCHRETKVQFKENGFYSMYEKYHNDLKNGKIDSTKGVTAEMIGATECQKCHY